MISKGQNNNNNNNNNYQGNNNNNKENKVDLASITDNGSNKVIEIDRTQYENLLQGKIELSSTSPI